MPRPAKSNTTQLNLRIDVEIKEAAQRAAEEDRRTLTSLIEKLLVDYCREHGFLPPPEMPAGRGGVDFVRRKRGARNEPNEDDDPS